ncbi:syntaxin binding protein 1 [Knufia obscura]|uniref:Syntaxin binding protein 1 n=2 Tax=Knufia TaxID=430999 RepID=A0AAN8EFK4_9EURO|nr:syntaxin binding protein 1 [Knufia obscura]KAK5949557.1 syntaxin binding protein 1 [Knufia fluminis]
MGTSIIEEQKRVFLQTIRQTSGNDWKVLVLDETSSKLLYNVVKEDDILNCNIISVDRLEDRRQQQPETDAIYLLSPLPHIVEQLKADLARRRYRRGFLIWTSTLPRNLGQDLFNSENRRQVIANTKDLNIDFYPRESHVVTFRADWSFHILYNPQCDGLVKSHLDLLTHKIVSVCVSLGEYPLVRYYRPKVANHSAAVLCSHLASFVQNALDDFARDQRNNFPPPDSPRPRAELIIADRTMDVVAPFVHELTYQAMAMDLLPVHDDGDKITYRNVIRRGQPDQEEKDIELNENDKLWVSNRHKHMKDLLVELSNDFKQFQAKNSQFAENDDVPVSVNTIKDMMAGLPEFQEGKEAFALHIDMAEKCAKIFQERKLIDISSTEQCLATGIDEDGKRPKNLADQVVRLLDDDSIVHDDRVRLLAMYIMYKYGILRGDIEKLRCHGELSPMDGEMIYNLDLLGTRVERQLKDNTTAPQPLFPPKIPQVNPGEEVELSRFEPVLRQMLDGLCRNSIDSTVYPPVKPHLDHSSTAQSSTSLRTGGRAGPTWASTSRSQSNKPRQRLIVFMAGGATYSEARSCYEISREFGKEVYLATTHMITPKTFTRQVSLLSRGRRELGLPTDQAPPKMPAWMSEPPPAAQQPKSASPQPVANGRPQVQSQPQPPTAAMQKMNLAPQPPQSHSSSNARPASSSKPEPPKSTFKDPAQMAKEKEGKKEKKHHFKVWKN